MGLMSYYVKVGDADSKIPECCNDCELCRNTYATFIVPGIPNQTVSSVHYNKEYKLAYYCATNDRIIQDISKKPDWCPIPVYPEKEKHCHNCRFFQSGSMNNCRPDYPNLCTNTGNIFYGAKKLKKEEEYKQHPECFVPDHREVQKWINDEWPL